MGKNEADAKGGLALLSLQQIIAGTRNLFGKTETQLNVGTGGKSESPPLVQASVGFSGGPGASARKSNG